MRKTFIVTALLLALSLAAACASPAQQTGQATPTAEPTPPPQEQPTAAGSGTHLTPASALASSCLGWPDREISPDNFIRFTTSLAEGEPAVDFALKDVNGASHTLSGLLETKSVLLVLGGAT